MEKTKRVRNRKGQAIGKTKGVADRKKWEALGSPEFKILYLPINLDLSVIQAIAIDSNLNFDYLLFIFHKIKYARSRNFYDKDTFWFKSGFTQLYSNDLMYWIGHNYKKYLTALKEHKLLETIPNDKGNSAYLAGELTIRYRIAPGLLENTNPKENHKSFKTYKTTNLKLIIKLEKMKLENLQQIAEQEEGRKSLALLLHHNNVYFEIDELWFQNKQGKPNIQLYYQQLHEWNDGNYDSITPACEYGERFHSRFTNLCSELRQFIRFNGHTGNNVYFDFKNSQFYFLSLLSLEHIFQQFLPEYLDYQGLFPTGNADYQLFLSLARSGELYEYLMEIWADDRSVRYLVKIDKKYTLKYLHQVSDYKECRDIIKEMVIMVLFGKPTEECRGAMVVLHRQLGAVFPSLVRMMERFMALGENILPKMLQLTESRILIGRLAHDLTEWYLIDGLITIHDGFILKETDAEMFEKVAEHLFRYDLKLNDNQMPTIVKNASFLFNKKNEEYYNLVQRFQNSKIQKALNTGIEITV